MTWAFGVSAGFAGQTAPLLQVVIIHGGEQPRDRRLTWFKPTVAELLQFITFRGFLHHDDHTAQPLGNGIGDVTEHLREHRQQRPHYGGLAAAGDEGDGKYALTAIVQHLFYDVRQSVPLTI